MSETRPGFTNSSRLLARLVLVLVAIAGLVAIIGSNLIDRDAATSRQRQGEVGVSFEGDLGAGGNLEEVSLPALDGDGSITYDEFRAKPLVINFFASWCPSCIAEMPEFERVHREMKGKVGFLGISQSDARSASVALVRQTGVTYQTGLDPEGRFFREVGGSGMPTTVFVRAGGHIAHVQVGALDASMLKQLIARHLGVSV